MKAHKQIISRFVALLLVFLFLLNTIAAAEEHLLPLQGTARINNAVLTAGDIIVEIYDAPTGGNMVYNSTNDFLSVISAGDYDILIGNGSQPLSLRFGTKYYMDIYLNGADMDFNGSERQVFMSTVGNITVTTPLATSSNDTDDALNVSGGTFLNGTTTVQHFFNVTPRTSAVRTNGTITILNTDADDTVNLTSGGLVARGQLSVQNYTAAGPAFTVNNGFNVSGSDNTLSTNGSILLNLVRSAAIFSVNNGFNISGTNGALTTNGSISIQNPAVVTPAFTVNNAFNLTSAGAIVTNETILTRSTRSIPAISVNDGFNISGTNQALITNGSISIQNQNLAPAFTINNGFNVSGTNSNLVTNGSISIQNPSVITPAFTVNNAFNLTSAGAIVTNETILTRSTRSVPAFSVNDGFNISGTNEALRTNGTVTILNADADDALNISDGGLRAGDTVDYLIFDLSPGNAAALFNIKSLFNISGQGHIKVAGNATIYGTDADDTVNLTSGGLVARGQISVQNYTAAGPAFTVNNGFNVSGASEALRTNGTVTITNIDADDAFNVTGSAVVHTGNLTVGQNITTDNQHFIKVGGVIGNTTNTNKCAYIQMVDENGGSHFMWFDTGGFLRMGNGTPSTCDGEGQVIGLQS